MLCANSDKRRTFSVVILVTMIFQTDVNWLEEKFTDCSVALALTIVNASNECALNHVETYFHDGCGDPFYNVPASIDPKVCFKTKF